MFLCSQQLQLLASIREVGGGALTQRRWFPLVTHLRSSVNTEENINCGGNFSFVSSQVSQYNGAKYMTWRTGNPVMDIVADT